MSKYLVLIYEDESAYASASPAELEEVFADHVAFQEIAQGRLGPLSVRSGERHAEAGCQVSD